MTQTHPAPNYESGPRRRRMRRLVRSRPVWVLLVLLGASVVATAVWTQSQPRVRTEAPGARPAEPSGGNPGYLGVQGCAECHSRRVAEFRATNHFRTCRIPLAGEMPPGFAPARGKFVTRFPGVEFEMRREGDEFAQTTIHTTPAGVQRTTTRIDLVLGAGTADDVYLSWRDDGRMYELPIAWLWPRERWGASHFCHAYGQGDFSREMTVRCVECHNTWMEQVPGTANQYRREGAILGVGCERCHGPGREHVAYHASHPGVAAGHAIVNPAGLERERLIEVCTQCHGNAITHRRPPFTYRPGEPLEDYYRTLTITRSEDDHVANQIQGLRQSKCFQESATMTCITCHDPHRPRAHAQSRAESCGQCHGPGDCGERNRLPPEVQNDCVGCHMPKRIKINVKFEVEGDNFVPPIRRFQHLIAVDPAARDEVLLAWYRGQSDARSREESVRLTRGLVEGWLAQAADYRQQYRFLAAIAALREALALDDAPATRAKLKELVEIQTKLYDDWARALHQITLNRPDEAVAMLEAILAVKPDDAEAHSKLGTIYAMAGQTRLAVRHLEAVAEGDPNNASGYGVLGKIASLDGQWQEALDQWRRAAEIEPYSAQIQMDLGRALTRLDLAPQAIEHLQRAHSIDPTRLDILSALIDALEQAGRFDDAIAAAARGCDLARTYDPAHMPQIRRKLEELRVRTGRSPTE